MITSVLYLLVLKQKFTAGAKQAALYSLSYK